MDAALDQLRAERFDVRDEDVARLWPLAHEHVNVLGRYAFMLPRAEPAICIFTNRLSVCLMDA